MALWRRRLPCSCVHLGRLSQEHSRLVTEGRWEVSNTDRARQNSEYVRRLLKKKWPEFAAALEGVVRELACTCHTPSAGIADVRTTAIIRHLRLPKGQPAE